jgi:hypothetical protein
MPDVATVPMQVEFAAAPAGQQMCIIAYKKA